MRWEALHTQTAKHLLSISKMSTVTEALDVLPAEQLFLKKIQCCLGVLR